MEFITGDELPIITGRVPLKTHFTDTNKSLEINWKQEMKTPDRLSPYSGAIFWICLEWREDQNQNWFNEGGEGGVEV